MIVKVRKTLQVFHTLKYLKLEQFWFRFLYRFKKPKAPLVIVPLSKLSWNWSGPDINNQSIFDDSHVRFLSLDGTVSSKLSWDDPAKENFGYITFTILTI